jgi:hypothetical protein
VDLAYNTIAPLYNCENPCSWEPVMVRTRVGENPCNTEISSHWLTCTRIYNVKAAQVADSALRRTQLFSPIPILSGGIVMTHP